MGDSTKYWEKYSHDFFSLSHSFFENVAQKLFGIHPLSHTQKCVDKSLLIGKVMKCTQSVIYI